MAISAKASADHKKSSEGGTAPQHCPKLGQGIGSLYSFIDQSLDECGLQKGHDFGLRQLSSAEKLP